ncbi:protein anachronism isoform X2 [Lucilia cuprina]|uniref:protein anachronism isoform X2 n=1 Tax=Lucilia cuprina TaxID=7375 RepID=UPI001F05076F|nr:protein anachronism isoform X2 [Lucilia cuprina]
MWHFTLLICYCLLVVISAGPSKRSTLLLDNSDTHTELVDRNNREHVLQIFNLTEAQMSRISAGINANNKESEADGRTMQYFNNIREFRINDIRNRISNAIQNVNSEENQEQHPLHEMAAYPICNSEATDSSWLQDNNITIQFSQTLFEQRKDLNLDSAILRLYKLNPNNTNDQKNNNNNQKKESSQNADEEGEGEETTKLKRCAEPNMDAQIRVTVSIVQQMRRNKRERKKRICNTVMMNVSQTGWVEIDIKRAIYIWEETAKQLQQTQQNRSPVLVGWLMIEVHDEEEQPLKPGLFFKPPNCNQADIAIPWNYYRPDTSMPSFATHEVPRYPRIDVKMIGYASFAPINQKHSKDEEGMYANLRRQVFNMTHELHDAESTTYLAPTADNHLDPNDNTASINEEKEMQQQLHREHFQHKRHLKLQQIREQIEELEQQKQQANEEVTEGQHKHKHDRHNHHHHHRRHHHHVRVNDEDNDAVTSTPETTNEQQQQLNDVKLLQHIAHKLQQEQRQLHLLHQQQQQLQRAATFNI